MKKALLFAAFLALASCSAGDWRDASLPAGKRASLLLKEMTLEEKIGQMCQYVGPCYVPPDQGSPYKNIDASDENLGNLQLAQRIREGKVGEVYNIGGHNEMRNIDIVKLICDALHKPYDLIRHVEDRKGHDQRYAIDPTKIHQELGWLPDTKFADGIKTTIAWYLEHKDWWENIISGEYQKYYEKMYGEGGIH